MNVSELKPGKTYLYVVLISGKPRVYSSNHTYAKTWIHKHLRQRMKRLGFSFGNEKCTVFRDIEHLKSMIAEYSIGQAVINIDIDARHNVQFSDLSVTLKKELIKRIDKIDPRDIVKHL